LRQQADQDGSTLLLTSHDTGDIEQQVRRGDIAYELPRPSSYLTAWVFSRGWRRHASGSRFGLAGRVFEVGANEGSNLVGALSAECVRSALQHGSPHVRDERRQQLGHRKRAHRIGIAG
jgi:hypothetical protein